MPDRRGEDRFALVARLPVEDADSGVTLGELIDISAHGLMLSAAEPLELHRRYRMRVATPAELSGALEVSAEAAWSVRALNPAGHRIGFRDLATAPGEEKVLDRLIEHCYAVTGP